MPVVSTTVWILTAIFIIALLAFDFIFHVRKAHIPTIGEAAKWTAIYVSVAILFGVWVWISMGQKSGVEYYAGYITELSLSVDNLFVFLIIMASFKVPRQNQQLVLMFGIVVSLIFRTGFIFLGAALINSFAWVFYIFGLILLVTAGNLIKPEKDEEDEESSEANNFIIRLAKRFMHTTDHYDGDKLFTIENGKKAMTPLMLVMIAIGGTDVMFALDSIPAIFGLTQNTYIVFTAVAFSLLGLRQLYFLVGGLLERLVYLSLGLAAILAFIGVKLVLHALHENNLPFINDGEPVPVIEISTWTSLVVIVSILMVTVAASLWSPKGKAKVAVSALRQKVADYLSLRDDAAPVLRRSVFDELVRAQQRVDALEPRFKAMVKRPDVLQYDLERAHEAHARTTGAAQAPSDLGLPPRIDRRIQRPPLEPQPDRL